MFTVKLQRRELKDDEAGKFTTKLLEANEVNVYTLKPNELFEIANGETGDKSWAYFIANPNMPAPTQFSPDVQFWDACFVENATGKTTVAIKF